ncbi:hypothetical protein L1887_49649 [Cichorium endivia]|nr:hypothetical protein L1887_49649 [Cichorium endivia]
MSPTFVRHACNCTSTILCVPHPGRGSELSRFESALATTRAPRSTVKDARIPKARHLAHHSCTFGMTSNQLYQDAPGLEPQRDVMAAAREHDHTDQDGVARELEAGRVEAAADDEFTMEDAETYGERLTRVLTGEADATQPSSARKDGGSNRAPRSKLALMRRRKADAKRNKASKAAWRTGVRERAEELARTADSEKATQARTTQSAASGTSSTQASDVPHRIKMVGDDGKPMRRHGIRERVLHFTPSWFSVTMGTGVIATLLNLLPWPSIHSGLRYPAAVFLLADIVIFIVFLCAFLARYVMYPEVLPLTIKHPQKSMFLGTLPMGLITIVSGIAQLGTVEFGLGVGFALAASGVHHRRLVAAHCSAHHRRCNGQRARRDLYRALPDVRLYDHGGQLSGARDRIATGTADPGAVLSASAAVQQSTEGRDHLGVPSARTVRPGRLRLSAPRPCGAAALSPHFDTGIVLGCAAALLGRPGSVRRWAHLGHDALWAGHVVARDRRVHNHTRAEPRQARLQHGLVGSHLPLGQSRHLHREPGSGARQSGTQDHLYRAGDRQHRAVDVCGDPDSAWRVDGKAVQRAVSGGSAAQAVV